MMPKRIQRKRTKGWRMPAGAVYVGRPTRWGNPFDVADTGRVSALMRFTRFIAPFLDVSELRGKDLACWCRLDQECHADILLEIANR